MIPVEGKASFQSCSIELDKNINGQVSKIIETQRNKLLKAVCTEDIPRFSRNLHPRVFKRTFSAPQLNRMNDIPPLKKGVLELLEKTKKECEHDEITSKHSALWLCVGRTPNKLGGFIYEFQLRKEYDSMTPHQKMLALKIKLVDPKTSLEEGEKIREQYTILKEEKTEKYLKARKKIDSVFPAIEYRNSGDLKLLTMHPSASLGYFLKYESECVKIGLPDKEALEINWEELRRSSKKDLPSLDILSSEGVADDMSFIEGHLQYDCLLSSAGEFFHDHTVHILPAIDQLFNTPGERARLIKIFAMGYKTLILAKNQLDTLKTSNTSRTEKRATLDDKIEMIVGGLSAYVDIATSNPLFILSNPGSSLRQHMGSIWDRGNWINYWKRRFTKKRLKNSGITAVWDELIRLEILCDIERNQLKPPKPLAWMDRILFNRIGQRIAVKAQDGSKEIYTNLSRTDYEWDQECVLQSANSGFVLMRRDVLAMREVRNLEEHPHLIDLACQYAAMHKYQTIFMDDLQAAWSIYLELGFRFQEPWAHLNDAMLIEYAKSRKLFSVEDEQRHRNIGLLLRGTVPIHAPGSIDPDVMDNQNPVPFYAQDPKVQDKESQLPNQITVTSMPTENIIKLLWHLLEGVPLMALAGDVFIAWKKAAQDGALETGSLIVSLGREKLQTDLADLRRRMVILDEKYFGNAERNDPPGCSCNLL